jgi:hypothetical protein
MDGLVGPRDPVLERIAAQTLRVNRGRGARGCRHACGLPSYTAAIYLAIINGAANRSFSRRGGHSMRTPRRAVRRAAMRLTPATGAHISDAQSCRWAE